MKYLFIFLYVQTAWHCDIPFREGIRCEKSGLQIICHKDAFSGKAANGVSVLMHAHSVINHVP